MMFSIDIVLISVWLFACLKETDWMSLLLDSSVFSVKWHK